MLPAKGVHLKDFRTDYFLGVMLMACLFAFNGGYVNAIGFAGVWRTGLTHLTGSTTNAAIRLVNPPKTGGYTGYDLLIFIFGFGLGAFVAGVVLGGPVVFWNGRHGVCCLLEGLALLLGWLFAPTITGGFYVGASMGIQNAITSSFSFFTLRTSHVSGMILDVGIGLGQCLHERSGEYMWKVHIHLPMWLAFFFGAMLGTVSYDVWDADALWCNIAFCWLLAAATLVYLVHNSMADPEAYAGIDAPAPAPAADVKEQQLAKAAPEYGSTAPRAAKQ
eukprot:gnl/Hemi2/28183_TR9304_c0_g1_i1.p2 gnl/Hemi2/28183_TR9304_c0_g1~~gnl/Hemi2/28183_TR9304_c0_g1_i1.p2  ORF type:complete len:276 (-),score=134.14 gnl/Hemi2/28183_TR9304_c0_g1_i1:128-955(-)